MPTIPMKSVIAILALCALAGCATPNQRSSIAALEVGLASAEVAAKVYVTLPRCPTAPSPCSDPATVARIKTADDIAFLTIKAAEKVAASGASVDLTASIAALTALQKLIPLIQNAQ